MKRTVPPHETLTTAELTAKISSASTTNTPTTEGGGHKSFLDLPPEIRNTIYHMALHDGNPVRLYRDPLSKVVQLGTPHERREGLVNYIAGVNLLRTCRQVHSEATPILYGVNHFEAVLDLRALHFFLDMIGKSRNYIRHVHCNDSLTNKSLLRSTVSRLKHTKDLQRLHFDYRVYGMMPAVTAAAQCRVFIQALYKTRGGAIEDTVNIVDVSLPDDEFLANFFSEGVSKRYENEGKEYAAELKRELSRFLE